MIRTIIFASAIALSAPALAQDAQAPAEAPSESTATQAPAEAAAAPAQDAAAAQPQAAAASQVEQVVNADFPAYDKDANGELSKEEFATWMLKMRQAGGDTATPEKELTAWAGAAFAQADADKNLTVSKGELTRFLAG
ncbi:EF-hand domain-containing protein [Sphingomonas sp. LaA6.9]|uniref:EF-hand domain-containing protein n=1 Tax=Sphingomonas sp. LaA6.9 TaxID=2919914 RepID=UPI001F4F4F0B|nr:EF-hand domain-containing protein [Sphingomonas sp. LaA6.9]MCJ8159414.1 EF-hand domain-containing protein [Sphingomonas sp. LaA6.9]